MPPLLNQFRDATRAMLMVWDGVAHPALAYFPGSPAARLRDLVNPPAPTETYPVDGTSTAGILGAENRLWAIADEAGAWEEDEARVTPGNPFLIEPTSHSEDDPSCVFWSDLPGGRMGAAVIMDCGIWVSTTWPKLAG